MVAGTTQVPKPVPLGPAGIDTLCVSVHVYGLLPVHCAFARPATNPENAPTVSNIQTMERTIVPALIRSPPQNRAQPRSAHTGPCDSLELRLTKERTIRLERVELFVRGSLHVDVAEPGGQLYHIRTLAENNLPLRLCSRRVIRRRRRQRNRHASRQHGHSQQFH